MQQDTTDIPRPFHPISQPPHTAGQRYNGLRSAIDPRQIPSAIKSAEADQAIWSNETFKTCDTQRTIPLSQSDYNALDQGNSSPRFVRACTYAIPNTYDLAVTCEVPLSIIVQPLAQQRPEELPIPTVDFGPAGPPRCDTCRTYMNPWCIWTMGGQRWICNICGKESSVSAEYFSGLDGRGRRLDVAERPELSYGTVDFVVPEEYWAQPSPPRLLPTYSDVEVSSSTVQTPRAPQAMATLFAIDISRAAVTSGLVAHICESIKETIFPTSGTSATSSSPFANRRVGFMTFDQTLNFYNVSPGLTQAGMIVVGDIEDVFAPFREGFFVDPELSRGLIEGLLDLIPRQFIDAPVPDVALGAALRGALAAMADCGGQVIVFQSSLPNIGPGALNTRDEAVLVGTDKEKTLFRPQESSWQDLAEECAEAGVGVNLFLFPTQYIDVASIGIVASVTGGELYFHPRFDADRDLRVLKSELRRLVMRETGYNVTIRVRVSSGLRVASYEGNLFRRTTDDVEMGTIDAEKAFSVTLEHEDNLDVRKDVYIQCAVLYTSVSGERRVRTHNLAIGVASLAGNVFRFADIDATVCVFAKEVLAKIPNVPLKDIREAFTEKCASVLLSYRRQCAASTAPTQLILPEAYKLLPVYALALLKSKALKGSSTASDVRMYEAHRLMGMGVSALLSFLYPKMIAIHDLADYIGVPDPQDAWIPMPAAMRPSYLCMEAHGSYLIDNGDVMILWLGAAVSPQILQDLFGVQNLDELSRSARLYQRDSHLSFQVQNIIAVLESRRGGRSIPLLIARQNMDAAEIEFSNLLVEDRNNDAMSYTDYICYVHKLINTALTTNSNVGGSSFWKTPW